MSRERIRLTRSTFLLFFTRISLNSHIGNHCLRQMALERKHVFDAVSFSEKRALAAEIVSAIRELDPPGRFLKKSEQLEQWEELPDERAIHKACQVMRDIDRADRKYREERRLAKKAKQAAHSRGDELTVTDRALESASLASPIYDRLEMV
jgi:hypothetical protein